LELKPCPFCGGKAKRVTHSTWDGVCSPGASCGNTACELYGHNQTLAWWNARADERDEFVEIILRLKQRGLIPETFDAATLEVAHA
jgi:hypothetical protein